jgi:hypothetical protein
MVKNSHQYRQNTETYNWQLRWLIICNENRLKRQVEMLKVEKSQIEALAQTVAEVKKQLGIQ